MLRALHHGAAVPVGAGALCSPPFRCHDGRGSGPGHAPNITLLPDTDLPGFDYSTIKDTTLDACQAACADDRICRAFTFNEKAKWCFLKSEVGEATAFKGATSGKIDDRRR